MLFSAANAFFGLAPCGFKAGTDVASRGHLQGLPG